MMARNVVILVLCILITGSMSVAPVNAEDIWTAKGAYDVSPYRLTRLFGNPGLSSDPDLLYINDHKIQACWIETYDFGVFRPAYAEFDGYAWRSANGLDTHRINAGPPNIMHPIYHSAVSASKVRIAPHPNPTTSSKGPYIIAGWNFPQLGFTDLFYLDVTNNLPSGTWRKVCKTSFANRSSFDVCYDDDFIYVAWIEYDKDTRQDQIYVSRFNGTTWQKLFMDTAVDPTHPEATILEGQGFSRFCVNIEVAPHNTNPSYAGIPRVSWEEEGEIYIAMWEPEIEPGRCGWVNLVGGDGSYTNVSDTPSRASHEPDFKLDPYYRPIMTWSEETFTAENTLAICVSKWSGGSWRTCDGGAGASCIPGTLDLGDAVTPSLVLGPEGENPIITWNQYVNEGDYVSALSIRGDYDWYKPDGNIGFEILNRYNGVSFVKSSRPFRLPDNPSYPWNGDCDFALLGSIRAPEYWFSYPQTDIFYSRYSTSWPAVGSYISLTATRPGHMGISKKGWFPIDVDSNETSMKRVRFKLESCSPRGQYLYLRFNSLVEPIAGLAGVISYWDNANSIWTLIPSSVPYPLPMPQSRWFRILVSDLDPENEYEFVVEYKSNPDNFHNPQYFYTEAFTSDTNLSPNFFFYSYNDTYNDTMQHDFVGFNIPHNQDYVTVTPPTLYVNACDRKYQRYTIYLQSPWGSDGFRYSFFLDNASELNELEYCILPSSGQTDKSFAIANVMVRAPCKAPATWYKPRLITELTHPQYQAISIYETDTADLLVRKPILSASKTANTSMAAIGDIVTYTIRITNRGSGDAKGIVVSDLMPKELEFLNSNIPAIPSGNAYNFLVDVPGNSSVSIRIVCRISDKAHLKAGDVITNMATVSGIDKPLVANMGITIKASNPGCETPQIELIISDIGRGNIIQAGRELDCQMIVHTGCNPLDAVIFWDDGSKSDRFEIGDDMMHLFTHTFEEPGDYLIRSTVCDPYGKSVNLYKHVHVIPASE